MVVPVLRGASAWLLALVPAVAGCSFDATFDGTRYRCGEGGACPGGYVCVAEACVASGADDVDAATGTNDASTAVDAASDGAPNSDGAPAVRFSDSFDDGSLAGWAPWDHPGCTVAETGGTLQLSFSGTGDAYCGADTNQAYDLRTGAVSVEIVEAPIANNFESYLILFSSTQQIHMIKGTGGLTMQLKLGTQVMASHTVPNDAAVRFWRVHTQGGTTYWETSTDGVAWTQRHSTTVAIDVSSMKVELAGGHYAPGPGSAQRSRFDHVTIE